MSWKNMTPGVKHDESVLIFRSQHGKLTQALIKEYDLTRYEGYRIYWDEEKELVLLSFMRDKTPCNRRRPRVNQHGEMRVGMPWLPKGKVVAAEATQVESQGALMLEFSYAGRVPKEAHDYGATDQES